jgi:hypothetical protein
MDHLVEVGESYGGSSTIQTSVSAREQAVR